MRSFRRACLWGRSTARKSSLRGAAGGLRSPSPTCRKCAPSAPPPSRCRRWSAEVRGTPIDRYPLSWHSACWWASWDSLRAGDSLWGNLKRASDKSAIKFPTHSWRGKRAERTSESTSELRRFHFNAKTFLHFRAFCAFNINIRSLFDCQTLPAAIERLSRETRPCHRSIIARFELQLSAEFNSLCWRSCAIM